MVVKQVLYDVATKLPGTDFIRGAFVRGFTFMILLGKPAMALHALHLGFSPETRRIFPCLPSGHLRQTTPTSCAADYLFMRNDRKIEIINFDPRARWQLASRSEVLLRGLSTRVVRVHRCTMLSFSYPVVSRPWTLFWVRAGPPISPELQ